MNNYFKVNEAEQYVFYRIPKALFTDLKYKIVSTDAKVLYSILLDRMGLSIENNWTDKNGNVYIYYTVESIENLLDFKRDKIRKLFRELEKADLLERKKQGLGKPDRLYVKKFIAECEKIAVRNAEKLRCRERINPPIEYANSVPTNTNKNYNDFSYNHLSISKSRVDAMEQFIKDNIDYDIIISVYLKESVDELVAIILDTICGTAPYVHIGNNDFPHEIVKSRLLKLNSEHIKYVMDSLKSNTTKVRNIRAYLLTSLYNAPATMDNYYQSAVNHDLYR